MRIIAITVALTLSSTSAAWGATPSQGIGFANGGLSGTGLSYHRTYANGYGWQVGGGAGYLSPGTGFVYDMAVSWNLSLAELEWGRLYALAGTSVYKTGSDQAPQWMVGGGIGIGLGPIDGITLGLDIPLVYMPANITAMPIPSASLYYNWSEHVAAESGSAFGLPHLERQGLGFSAGPGGIGATYHAWLPNGWGGSLTGLVFGSGSSPVGSVGVAVNRLVSESGTSRFYLTGAGSTFGSSGFQTSTVGVGFGMELGVARGVVANLDLLTCEMFESGSTYVMPLPNVGLTFYY